MDELLKRKLVYASAFSLAAMLIIVSFFSISLKNVTVNQANKLSNLTHSYNVKSVNATQLSNKIAQLEANISNLTSKLKLLESNSNSFALQENLSKRNITTYQNDINSLDITLNDLNKSYNTAESLYHLVDRSLSYSLSKLSADNLSIFNLSSELALKNQNISNLSLRISKLKGSLASDNISLANLSSELALKNQNISNLSLRISKLKGSLASDNISLANLSSELALKNQNISNLSSEVSTLNHSLSNAKLLIKSLSSELSSKDKIISKLKNQLTSEESELSSKDKTIFNLLSYIYEENFIPSKITTMNLNYSHSTIRSIAQNGSNLAIVGNKTDPSYFVFIYNIKSNLTQAFQNNGITNIFSSVSNGKGFTFLVKFKNDSTGLVQYNKNLTNLTFFKNYTDFYPVGLAYNDNGYLVTGYSKKVINNTPPSPSQTTPPSPPSTTAIIQNLLYYNPSKNSIIDLSSNLSSFQGYNFTNPVYNGTNYYILGYTDPPNPPSSAVLKLSLLSYNSINNTLKNVSNISLPIIAGKGKTISQANLSLSWNGAYFLISGSYLLTPSGSDSSPSNILEIYNPATNLWINITGKIDTNKEFTSNMIWNGTSFITALTNSTGSGLYYLGR